MRQMGLHLRNLFALDDEALVPSHGDARHRPILDEERYRLDVDEFRQLIALKDVGLVALVLPSLRAL